METFNLFCISFLLIEFYSSNVSIPTYLFLPSLIIHILSQKLFTGIVITSSVMELFFYLLDNYKFYMMIVPYIDEYIVGLLLNIVVASGICLSKIKYGKKIPRHIHKTIQRLKILGLFWFLFDKTTQNITSFDIFYIRMCINIFSCWYIIKIQEYMRKKL